MDSYDLFGEDGSGMLEGLPELGTANFVPTVTGTRNVTSAYSQPTYSQETPLQKLATFGGPDFNHMDPSAQSMYAQGYGTDRPMGPPGSPYPHQRQMVRPPASVTSGQYPYQTDTMYSIPDAQVGGMGESNNIQAAVAANWSQHTAASASYPGIHRYSQMTQYRQQPMGGYPHQQEQKQFPTAQHPLMQQPHQPSYQIQQRHTPHYPQPTSSYPNTAVGHSYAGYIHQRLPHHHQYPQPHHQMDMSNVPQTQQYSQLSHGQPLTHPPSHGGPVPGHMGQTPHSIGHAPTQPHSSSQQPTAPNSMTHPNTINYNQGHQNIQPMQRPMDVAPTQQQFAPKHPSGPIGNASPQYRASYPQLSPQISPRPQMSPRPSAPQISPRPVMSPAKSNMSPHPPSIQQSTLSPRPASSLTPKGTVASPVSVPPYSQQSTLQALEQMVIPPSSTSSTEYPPYQSRNTLGPPTGPQNPLSPAVSVRNAVTEQWPPVQSSRTSHLSNISGSIGIVEQHSAPTTQAITSPQTLTASSLPNTSLPSAPNIPVGFRDEDVTVDINKTTTICDMQTKEREACTTQSMSVNSKNDFISIQSPSTSLPDKIPSSTTNIELNIQTSTPPVSSHPPTPTPTSTTDDNINTQDPCLPSNSDSVKQMNEFNDTTSTSQQQTPSQSSATNNFTDFNCVSSMTGYPSHLETLKSNKIDDAAQSNVSVFSQDNSVSQESLAESTKSELSSVSSPRLQSPSSQTLAPISSSMPSSIRENRNLSYNGNQNISSNVNISSPTQSHSVTNQNVNQSSPVPHGHTLIPNQNSTSLMMSNMPHLNQSNIQCIQQTNSTSLASASATGKNTHIAVTSVSAQNSPLTQPSNVTSTASQQNLTCVQESNTTAHIQNPSHLLSQSNVPNMTLTNNLSNITSQSNLTNMVGSNNVTNMPGQNIQSTPNINIQSGITSVVNQQNTQNILGSTIMSNIQSQAAVGHSPLSQHIPVSQGQQPLPISNPNITIQNTVSTIPPSTQQLSSIYEQNSQVIGSGIQLNTTRGLPPHGLTTMGHPGITVGMGIHPAIMQSLGSSHSIISGQEMQPYQPPISHHQERAALQQQIQELYCMPPASEHQEKIAHLQERLNILTQHEINDQCNGGQQCVLQSPLFTSPMIDSPQVTSTTGRGRSKGASKARKPRNKKGEKDASPIQVSAAMPLSMATPQQLPVSEDCVTPGAGLSIPSNEISDFAELGIDPVTGEPERKKGRKPRESKKPKTPKSPKEARLSKERKRREPKEAKVKRKYVRKKKSFELSEESATEDFFNKTENIGDIPASVVEEQPEATAAVTVDIIKNKEKGVEERLIESSDINEGKLEEIQADSQTHTEIFESTEDSRKDEYNFDDQLSPEIVELPKRIKKPRPPTKKVVATKAKSKKSCSSSRKRKGMMPESDGEGEDLVSTPPPSPPEDSDIASTKRRSARNTQRKKYIDDVMLRFSDDDTPVTPTKSRKPPVPTTPFPIIISSDNPPVAEDNSVDSKNQMNYVYINTTEEDSMVVQHVLCSRIARRPIQLTPSRDENKEAGETKLVCEGKTNRDKEFEDVDDINLGIEKDSNRSESSKTKNIDNENPPEIVEVEEYYVKYRNFSYLHCEWKTEEELYKGDKRIGNKIKRFKQKQAQQMNIFENLEDEPFNPDYTEVDRVLDVSEHTDPASGDTVKHYLVKWRALQYEDCTWELEEDVDPLKIEQYERFNKIPPKDKWKCKKRPSPESWSKLENSPIYKSGNSLREYQLEGLNWLLFSWYNGRNCILADEMGLGKTIQSLTFLNSLWEYGIRGPFLVIAPLSTIPNWQREIESWTEMNVIVYHGSAASRNMIQEYEMYYKNEKGQFIKDLTKFNILITTFEIIVTDFADLKGFNWRVCVIDEAHRLKNRNCKLLEGLRQLTLEHRVLLSGTPLQNNVNELFSLLNFLEPNQFPSSDAFIQEFGALKTEQEVQKLQCLLKPMMLRRLKEDVEKSLAPKEETVVEVELTNIQKKYYRAILERNFSFLSKGTTHANIPNLMNTMMELRKCCIHPYLLNGAEEQIQYDFKNQHGEDPDSYYKSLIHSSGKMVLIDKLLPKLKANGHRVLIFSQMVKCLDILEDYLMYRKYPYERIDGRIRGNLRQAAIDRFSRPDSDRFVFLLCTKAGGLGINLTAADTVIIYDSDWNPQNDLQAQARCHRIGQQKMVKIYRLLCRNTYEREMFDKASLKLGLDKAILQSMNTSQGGKETGSKQLSKKEIEDLLKKGAYGALLDEDDGDKFCEEDIDVILARRTQVITMESEKGSTFSKASFASSANRSDIALDDPDFWNKWAKKAEIDTTEKDESEDLVISEPRRRTQIKRYGHDESAIDMSELESSSDSDPENESLGLGIRNRRNKFKKKRYRDEYIPRDSERGDIVYGSWARRECFMVERGLLTFGWGRWQEILHNSQLRKGWKDQDIEDCARVILLYCLRFYRGDEKIRGFIWDLIAPSENGEQKISRNHHGLKDPVPRGIRNKNKNKNGKGGILTKDNRHPALTDPNHWSKNEKYDGDIFLESNYKKHLGRHANKVLLRVRMLYYIKHEIIGDLVQHIADGVHANALPIYPPVTEQLPSVWWDSECDKSLLIGTWKHGYENYTAMRVDPTLCFLSRCGLPSDSELQMATSNTQPPTPALNDDEMEDEDTNEDITLKSKNRDISEANSEVTEPSPGPSASSETQHLDAEERTLEESVDDKNSWPTITDLNTRLRRVITSYQRSYRKEEQKLAAAKPKKMERQGKQVMEHAIRDSNKEREKLTIGRKWTKREESDFFRVASSYGVIYYRKKKSYDWLKFKQLAKLEKKCDDDLTEYYKHFVMMCKKQTGMNVEEGSYDTSIEHISEEKARRTLERLELLSRIREEILTHPKLDERLRVCITSADMPEWWIAGKHDKELLLGVAKHGLGRTDYYLLNDPELSFHDILRKKVFSDTKDTKEAIKLESHEDILKFDKNEILVKLEKGEGTLKIEKVALKKDTTDERKEDENSKINLTILRSDLSDCDDKANKDPENMDTQSKEFSIEETEVCKTPKIDDLDSKKLEEENKYLTDDKESDKMEPAEDIKVTHTAAEEVCNMKVEKQAQLVTKPSDSESDICSKQAAELKAMFPDLEVIQPLSRLSQVDTFVLCNKQESGALDFSETTVAQMFNNAVKWPKEYAIQVRLQHIIYAVETKEWPATKSFSAYATGIGNEFDVPIHELPSESQKRETSTPVSLEEPDTLSINTDRSVLNKKRKRHIAIDVETERAKLHALLNSSHIPTSISKHGVSWDNEDSEESRRSTPSNLQPPPAHQHTSRLNLTGLKMPYDLAYHTSPSKTIGQTTVIPGTSSTLTPIDLSSSLPKKSEKISLDIQNEVQDFSVRKSSSQMSSMKIGNKLDDTLSKLMKRKNCPEPELLIGKEKKRRKLDEIVLGLSAAKEQSLFPEPSKKPAVTPSVTVTPTSAPVSSSHNLTQKPFTITVTSVPSSAPSSKCNTMQNMLPSLSSTSKDSFSTFLAQAEQQNLLLKKQQQRKSYEAMIADINKVSDYNSKVNTYSHEAKVNKWLAEQNVALAEQPLTADYLSPRRRRPRVDPTLLDWKKLTGDENVAVIHRATGKKLTGPKAPTLKRLGQWLIENPMYDIDPKWSDLVKERGNLSHDLQKRLPGQGSNKSKSTAPGRPPLLASPTGSTSSVSSANLTTSLPSSMSFPSLNNSGLISGLSGLGQFDPKTNPLLMPFAGLPNIGALGSIGGLGNITNMNLFANLASLGLPGLSGVDAATLANAAEATKNISSKTSTNTNKQHKPQDAHSSNKNQSSSNSSMSTSNPFPFFFPNPSLLYTPLGLSGLNPFTMQPGMSTAYDALAQQCGLLNGSLNSAGSPNSSSKLKSNISKTSPSATSANQNKLARSSSRDAHLQQLLLPSDTQILENITKASLDISLKHNKTDKKDDKRKTLESLRGMFPTDILSSVKDKKGGIPGLADFTKLLEAQVSHSSKKSQEYQMKEALEQFTKTNAELMAKALAEEQSKLMSGKKSREITEFSEKQAEEEQISNKKIKDCEKSPISAPTSAPSAMPTNTHVINEQDGVDIEALLPPSTVVKSSNLSPEKNETGDISADASKKEETEIPKPLDKEELPNDKQCKTEVTEEPENPPKKSTKRTRGKRKSSEISIDPESVIAKKNLRSSASRSAAVAAARQKLEAENAQRESENSVL